MDSCVDGFDDPLDRVLRLLAAGVPFKEVWFTLTECLITLYKLVAVSQSLSNLAFTFWISLRARYLASVHCTIFLRCPHFFLKIR